MIEHTIAAQWYEWFNRFAGDLYPGRYTRERCLELAGAAVRIRELARQKGSTVVAHNYLYPEYHEIAHHVGDSLGLAFAVRDAHATRVDFESVFFMGATAKLINGDATRVFVADTPDVLGCSLVSGTDHAWLDRWKARNPDGVLVTYVNSDVATKAKSDYIMTSRNADAVILAAAREHPGKPILVLPDQYLGFVMRQRAVERAEREGSPIDPKQIEVYTHAHNGQSAACYVHEKIGERGVELALDTYPDAELLIHPECGCASSCLFKLNAGIIPHSRAYFCSTEQMLDRARTSPAKEFIVATEMGMVYRLRKAVPGRTFHPVSGAARCEFMKANTLEKLERSLREDRLEIVFCDDCCDPIAPFTDDRVVHIPRSAAAAAKASVERMLAIQ